MLDTIQIAIDGNVHRCYRARTPSGDGMIECWVVAGVGSVTISRDSGAIVGVAAVIEDGARVLERLAPIIHSRAPVRAA